MNSPDMEQIKKMVADLDAAVPRDGAQVCLSQYGGGPDESKVVANQRGYLRLGIEFLRAAFAAPSPKAKEQVQADLRYLLTDDSDIGFDWFERREDLMDGAQTGRRSGKVFKVITAICMLALVAGLILAIIGLVTVIGWMTK
jgi:hypothetical protein